ncbi:MAG: site-specific DNA-methyltransferase [Chloroflexi bacterium]|nr:site-specific DNA-methyltransferase [Chloroflexota bacterium]
MSLDAFLTEAARLTPENTIGGWLGKVHTGDCLDLLPLLPQGSIDLIVTSPPYNLKNSTGNGLKDGRGGKWPTAGLIEGYDGHDDAMPNGEYIEWMRDVMHEMMRVLREDGALFFNHKWRVQGGELQRLADKITAGFPVRQIIIWRRSGGINFNPGYFVPTYEVIYLIAKPEFLLAPKANAHGDVWDIRQEMRNPHPAPFPIELAQRCIESTNARIVLDPMIGSGSTAIAAEVAGRKWIGMEVSEQYTQVANERILAHRRAQ